MLSQRQGTGADAAAAPAVPRPELQRFSAALSLFLNVICRTGSDFDFGSATIICDAIAQFHGTYAIGHDPREKTITGSEALFHALSSKFIFSARHEQIMELLDMLKQNSSPQLASTAANKVPLFPARLFESMLAQAVSHTQALGMPILSLFYAPLPTLQTDVQNAIALRLSAYDPTFTNIKDYLLSNTPVEAGQLQEPLTFWTAIAADIRKHRLPYRYSWSPLETVLFKSKLTPVRAILDMHWTLKPGPFQSPLNSSEDNSAPDRSPTPRFSYVPPELNVTGTGAGVRATAAASPRAREPSLNSSDHDVEAIVFSSIHDRSTQNYRSSIQVIIPAESSAVSSSSPTPAENKAEEYYAIARVWQITRSIPGPVLLALRKVLHEKDPDYFDGLMCSFLRIQAIAFMNAHGHAFSGLISQDLYHTRLLDYLLRWQLELPRFKLRNAKLQIMVDETVSRKRGTSSQQTFRNFIDLLNESFFFPPEFTQSKLREAEARFYQNLFSFKPNFGFDHDVREPIKKKQLLELMLCLQANPQLLGLMHQLVQNIWSEAPALDTLNGGLTSAPGLLDGHYELVAAKAPEHGYKLVLTPLTDIPNSLLPTLPVLHSLFERCEISCVLASGSLAGLGVRILEKIADSLGSFNNLLDDRTRIAYVRACLRGIEAHKDLVWEAWETWSATRTNHSEEKKLTLSNKQSLSSARQILEWAIAEYEYKHSMFCSWPACRRLANYLPPLISLGGLSTSLYFLMQHILNNPNQDNAKVMFEGGVFYALVAVVGLVPTILFFAPRWQRLRFSEEVSYLLKKPSPNRNGFIGVQVTILILTITAATLYSVFYRLFEQIIAAINNAPTPPTPSEGQTATRDENIGFPSEMVMIFLGSMFTGNLIAIGLVTGFFAARLKSCTRPDGHANYRASEHYSINNATGSSDMLLVTPTPQRPGNVTGLRAMTRADRDQPMQSIFPEPVPVRARSTAYQLFNRITQPARPAQASFLPNLLSVIGYKTPQRGNPHDVRFEDL